jgi:hypothetical protein
MVGFTVGGLSLLLSVMSVLAHGGGAPEAAMIGLPLLLFGVFFRLERRARRRERAAQDGTPPDESSVRQAALPDPRPASSPACLIGPAVWTGYSV